MKKKLLLLLFFVVCAVHSFAITYYVATNGSNSNNGTSLSTPYQTIQKAASVAVAGDVINVRAGTYRETVIPANSGTAGNPITYQPYNNEIVIVSGADIIGGWSVHSGNIYKATMPSTFLDRSHNQDDQIFVDGKMMFCAKWPNQTVLDPTYPAKSTMTAFVSKSQSGNVTTGVFDDGNLAGGDYVGADIYVQPNFEAWSWLFTGKVKSVSGSRITLESFSGAGQDGDQTKYAVGSRYYIYNKLSLLDAAGEWFHDNNANLLYLWAPSNANPSTKLIEAKKREFGFKIDGLSYLTIKGLQFFACTITGDAEIGGDCKAFDATGNTVYPWRSGGDGNHEYTNSNIIIDGITATYLTHYTNNDGFQSQQFQGMGLYIAGNDNIVRNCTIKYSAGHGIIIAGRRGQVTNNVITDVGYQCAEGAAISMGVSCVAYDHKISYNTIKRCGRWGIGMRNLQNSNINNQITRINNNDVSEYMLQDWDGGATYTANQDAKMVRVDHNYFHDALGTMIAGFYVDYSKNWVADHNIIWNVTRPCHIQGMHNASSENNLLFYNNTCAAKGSVVGDYAFGVSGYSNIQRGTVMQNNIFYLIEPPIVSNFVMYTLPGEMVRTTNLEFDRIAGSNTDPKFTNVAGANFTLGAGSSAINTGTAIPTFVRNGITVTPYNDPITGTIDIGALESGTPMFGVGATPGTIIPVTGITLSKTSSPVIKGVTLPLSFTLLPGNATNNKVTWSSSNTAIATVNVNGVVSGVALGNANIIATTNDGNFTAQCAVNVRLLNNGEFVTAINAGGNAYTDNTGVAYLADQYFTGGFATYNGDNFFGGTDYEIYQRSRVGTSFSYEIPVPEERFYQVTFQFVNVSYTGDITGQNVMDIYGETQKIVPDLDIYPQVPNKNIYSKTVDNVYIYDGKLSLSFLSKNSNNISVNGIIIKAAPNPPAIVNVSGINLNVATLNLGEGASSQLVPTLLPSNASNKGVLWSTSNSNIATVSTLGIVTAANTGNCTITGTTVNGGFTKTCAVTVTPAVADATVLSTTSTITIDGTKEAAWNGATANVAKVLAGTISNAADCSGNWTSLWDNNFLYFYADVTDDVRRVDSGPIWYADDRVELYIDGGFERGISYDANDFQYYFHPGDNLAHEAKRDAVTGVVVSSVINATGYRIEVKIPWTTLGVTASNGKKLGLDVMIGDDDDGGDLDGKLGWYSSVDQTWSNPSLMALAKLSGTPSSDTQAPTVPNNLTSANVAQTSFNLNWNASTDNIGVTGYEVFRNGTSVGTPTGTSFNVTGLNASTSYSMSVRSRDAAGNNSAQSTALSVTTSAAAGDTQAPSVPASLSSASIAQTSFTLNWNAATDNVGVTGYEVFRAGTSIGTPTGTSFNVTGLTASTAYSMTVRARDAAGNFSSPSSALNVTTSAASGGGGTGNVTLETWTGIGGTLISNIPQTTTPNTTATLTSLEIPSDNADNYAVRIRGYIIPSTTGNYTFYAAGDDNVDFSLSTNNLPANASRIAYHTDWTDPRQWNKYPSQQSSARSLNAGTKYYFEALMKEGSGGDNLAIGWTGPGISNITVIGAANLDVYVAPAGDTQAPSVPASLSSASVGQTSFTLNWNAASDNVGVTGYEVFRGGTSIGTPTGTSFNVTGLSASTAYSMTVRARDAAGNFSNQSSALNVTTSPASGGSFPIITARGENAPNEDKTKAFDLNNNSKWLDFSATSFLQIQYASAVAFNQYVMVSGNDAPERDPKNWTIQGSNNGTNWTTLSTQSNQTWTGRNQARTFTFSNTTAYAYYKLGITANGSGTLIQLSELTYSNVGGGDTQAPSVPNNLSSSSVAQTSFTLNWNAASDNVGVTGYEVFRGGTSIGTPTGTSFNVTGLSASTAYSMTVRARDAAGNFSNQSTALSVTTSAASGGGVVPNAVMHLKFNETSGTFLDDLTTFNNNGTRNALATFATTGIQAGCLNFTGVENSDVTVPSSASLSQSSQITVSIWYNAPSSTTGGDLIMKRRYDPSYALGYINQSYDRSVKFKMNGFGEISAPFVESSIGLWHMATGTYDGASMKLYLDGVLVTNTPKTGAIDINGDALWIGSSQYGGYFNGRLDEARVYSRALTASEIASIYTTSSTSNQAVGNETSILNSPKADITSVYVYPNPATTSFSVATPSDNAKITVTATNGTIIKIVNANAKITTIDSGNWAAGVYLIQIQTGVQTTVKKVVIAK